MLVSCSTSIDDSSSAKSARGLSVAITTGTPARHLSREAEGRESYKIIVSVKGGGYKDSQTQMIDNSGKVDFNFEDVPVGITVTAECQISLGSTVIYKASDTAVVEPEGTIITLQLQNVLESMFVIDDTISVKQFVELMGHYKLATDPTFVFTGNASSFNVAKNYIGNTSLNCNADFSNITKTSMNATDYDDIFNMFNLCSNIRNFILPNNLTFTLDSSSITNFSTTLSKISTPISIKKVTTELSVYEDTVRAIANNTNVTVAELTMSTVNGSNTIPAVSGVTPTNIRKITTPSSNATLTVGNDAFKGWVTNVCITVGATQIIMPGALSLGTGGTFTIEGFPDNYWDLYDSTGYKTGSVKARNLSTTNYDATARYDWTTTTD